MSRCTSTVLAALVTVSILGISGPAHANDAWTQRGDAVNGTAGDRLGWSVATSSDGNTMIVGAPRSDAVGTDSGQVQVYGWNGTGWIQRGSGIDGEAAGDESGYSVAMSADGSVVAMGAPENSDAGFHRGHVRVYAWDGTNWLQRGNDIDGEADGDLSGTSVALSSDGTILAIGAPRNDDAGSQAGHVRVYAWDGTNWLQRGNDIDGEVNGDLSGTSVALSSDGTILAVGAPRNDAGGASAGQIRVYSWNGTNWIQRGVDIDGEAAGDQLGLSAALSSDGSIVAAGGPFNGDGGTDAGYVEVHVWDGTNWTQRGTDINGNAGDESGTSVALSSDGATLAIGAPENGDIGTSSGQVRVFLWDEDAWSQRGGNINGLAAFDELGTSVALSTDASVLTAGAPFAGGGTSAGQVRGFTWQIASGGGIPGPATYFTFLLPDGRECSSISPVQVQVGMMVELPGVDALCQTTPGSSVAGWSIPVAPGFTGYGSASEPFPPGLRVRVIESQRFTVVPFEPVVQIEYDANVATRDSCVPANLAHTSDTGRVGYSWVPREDFAMARTWSQAPCTPDGHELIGWNTRGDGTGEAISIGTELPSSWAQSIPNHRRLYAMWRSI